MVRDVAVMVGSLRKDSFSRKVADALAELAPPSLALRQVPIGDLPYYNEDIEPSPPAEWTRFRDAIRSVDALLFVTPEYNRLMPAVLKNAIDVASRPYGKSVFAGKPAGIVSVSPGAIGGYGANHSVRVSISGLNVPIMPHPDMYLGGAGSFFGGDGALVNEGTRKLLTTFLDAFAPWIEKHAASAAAA